APLALVFLVALSRRRWALVAVMVVLAALVKPQFAILVVVLFAARRWRMGGAALLGIVVTNLVAYLLWPHDFPGTIAQSIRHAVGYTSFGPISTWWNVSFGNGLFSVTQEAIRLLTGHEIPREAINPAESIAGFAILVVVVVAMVALGRRIDPLMA